MTLQHCRKITGRQAVWATVHVDNLIGLIGIVITLLVYIKMKILILKGMLRTIPASRLYSMLTAPIFPPRAPTIISIKTRTLEIGKKISSMGALKTPLQVHWGNYLRIKPGSPSQKPGSQGQKPGSIFKYFLKFELLWLFQFVCWFGHFNISQPIRALVSKERISAEFHLFESNGNAGQYQDMWGTWQFKQSWKYKSRRRVSILWRIVESVRIFKWDIDLWFW